jgi:sodium/bile acid cotransporter 7
MGWLRRLGIGLSALGAQLGLVDTPQDDDARQGEVARLYARYQQEFPDVPSIDAATLAELQQRDEVLLVDVRTEAERAVSTLPGAIPAEDFDPSQAHGRTVVAYCTIGYRSGLWAAEQREHGVDAANLQGSLLAWTHAGQPLVAPDGSETRRLHVYGPRWDLARSDYEAVW